MFQFGCDAERAKTGRSATRRAHHVYLESSLLVVPVVLEQVSFDLCDTAMSLLCVTCFHTV